MPSLSQLFIILDKTGMDGNGESMLLSYSFFAHLPPGGSCNQMSMLALAAVAPKLMCTVFNLQLLQCGFIFHRKRFAKAQKTS